jgi:hypothetical protein
LTIGVLPTAKDKVSRHVDVPIITEMGSGRNNINVLTSHVVVACFVQSLDEAPSTADHPGLVALGQVAKVMA